MSNVEFFPYSSPLIRTGYQGNFQPVVLQSPQFGLSTFEMEAQNLSTSLSYPLPLNFTMTQASNMPSRGQQDDHSRNNGGSSSNSNNSSPTATTQFRLSALQPVPFPFIPAHLPPPPPVVVTPTTTAVTSSSKIPPPPPVVVNSTPPSTTTTTSHSSGTRDLITVLEGTPPMYQCNICNKKFKTKAHIRYHEFCQTGDKPFKCDQCGQGFITKGHYEYHQRTHSGEKAYTCPKCGKGFHQPGQVTRHMRSHNSS